MPLAETMAAGAVPGHALSSTCISELITEAHARWAQSPASSSPSASSSASVEASAVFVGALDVVDNASTDVRSPTTGVAVVVLAIALVLTDVAVLQSQLSPVSSSHDRRSLSQLFSDRHAREPTALCMEWCDDRLASDSPRVACVPVATLLRQSSHGTAPMRCSTNCSSDVVVMFEGAVAFPAPWLSQTAPSRQRAPAVPVSATVWLRHHGTALTSQHVAVLLTEQGNGAG